MMQIKGKKLPKHSKIYDLLCKKAYQMYCHLADLHPCPNIDGFVQEKHNSIANVLGLCLSCTNPLICNVL